MAASRVLQNAKVLLPVLCRVSRDSSSSASVSPTKHRVQHYLYNSFYDIEAIINWSVRFKQWNLRRKNAHYAYTERLYGKYVAAAYYTLSQRGGVRFQGHKDWYRADRRGKFSWDFLEHKEVPVECIDLSRSPLTFRGLDNIVSLKELRELYLNNCPHLDDWALSRLHVFKDSLEVLSIAGCPSITERGLATLHHLQNLRYLDLSDLSSVTNKGLIRILMEEVLPKCEIVGINYFDGDQRKSSHNELQN
ncbi:distal membrane-arm assembly complex protein 2 isoform X2 [Xenopus tropicalis]|uniref:Distal membrane-arm assembly complex protein 2 n=1 Tax=Xenopus tropicalis TaxID=8364 RepID=A0A8J1IRZ8_XENTR|nr:distal membrane-arm assembly complex protein 2 isoform X2 [Xenopus tropicalis]XP_031747261.1 distal membrane-arm assembly complex protein 2 isoform X2 [Xenopus tropicalis]|eukprot:XP_012824506.1 PREDICTED: ATP synthase subunit s-like protein [Xenopus tropicalis]